MFKTAKIVTLLAWGFGLVILLIVGMTCLVLVKNHTVNQNAAYLAHDVNPKIVATAAIRLNIMRNWSNSLLLAQVTDSAEIKRITDEMAEITLLSNAAYDYLEKSVVTEQGLVLMASALKQRQVYTSSRKKYLDLLKAGNKEEANQYLGSTLRGDIRSYSDAIGKVFEFQSNKMVNVQRNFVTNQFPENHHIGYCQCRCTDLPACQLRGRKRSSAHSWW